MLDIKDIENTIICGDCLSVMKDWPDKCVDLCLCDPPYGIDYQSAWRTDHTQWKPKIANDDKPFVSWIYDAHRVLKDSGRLICFYRWDVQQAFLSEMKIMGFYVKSQIVWDKIVHGMGDLKGEFAPQHENILYASKGRYEFLGKRPKSVMRHTRVMPEQLKHPNEKPILLIMNLIRDLSAPTDLILDPFCGSGTTCLAAKMLGRRYIGIEISEEYCQIARERIKAVETGVPVKEARNGQKGLFE